MLYLFLKLSDLIETEEKFRHSTQNEMEDIIKYVLAQAPFNLKKQIEKKANFYFV